MGGTRAAVERGCPKGRQPGDSKRPAARAPTPPPRELLATSGASGLGHSNPRQKIQYHLKLKQVREGAGGRKAAAPGANHCLPRHHKHESAWNPPPKSTPTHPTPHPCPAWPPCPPQELEELRHECTLLLREKFQLEQCVRYLAVRARVPLALEPNAAGTGARSPLAKVQPGSLAGSVLFSTPIGQKSMRLGGRGRAADEGTVYNSPKVRARRPDRGPLGAAWGLHYRGPAHHLVLRAP
jgi:hypothetical protein